MVLRGAVGIREVGPREALQAHAETLPTAQKVELVRRLLACGITKINVVSLVSPKAMPHMADAEAVLEQLGPIADVQVSGLAPNQRAMDRALALAAKGLLNEVFLLHAATSSVLRANGLPESLDANFAQIATFADQAKAAGLRVGCFVSAAFGCSMEGQVAPATVLAAVEAIVALSSIDEVVVSDSTGQADPVQVAQLLSQVSDIVGETPVTLHFHDSRGTGLANAVAAVQSPIKNLTLDASFGGLGGDIPFIPEAAGNVATEDLVAMLDGMGVHTGIDAAGVVAVAKLYNDWTAVPLRSSVPNVGPVRWKLRPAS